MHIKEISLDGFKSYAQRVVIPGFDPQFNAITGLNGSGKSNILDSICFLLGISNLQQVGIHSRILVENKNWCSFGFPVVGSFSPGKLSKMCVWEFCRCVPTVFRNWCTKQQFLLYSTTMIRSEALLVMIIWMRSQLLANWSLVGGANTSSMGKQLSQRKQEHFRALIMCHG